MKCLFYPLFTKPLYQHHENVILNTWYIDILWLTTYYRLGDKIRHIAVQIYKKSYLWRFLLHGALVKRLFLHCGQTKRQTAGQHRLGDIWPYHKPPLILWRFYVQCFGRSVKAGSTIENFICVDGFILKQVFSSFKYWYHLPCVSQMTGK